MGSPGFNWVPFGIAKIGRFVMKLLKLLIGVISILWAIPSYAKFACTEDDWIDSNIVPFTGAIQSRLSPSVGPGMSESLTVNIQGYSTLLFYWKPCRISDSVPLDLRFYIDDNEYAQYTAESNDWIPVLATMPDGNEHTLRWSLQNQASGELEDESLAANCLVWCEQLDSHISWNVDYESSYDGHVVYKSPIVKYSENAMAKAQFVGDAGMHPFRIGYKVSEDIANVRIYIDGVEVPIYPFSSEGWQTIENYYYDLNAHDIKIVYESNSYGNEWEGCWIWLEHGDTRLRLFECESSEDSNVATLDLINPGRQKVSEIMGGVEGVLLDTDSNRPWLVSCDGVCDPYLSAPVMDVGDESWLNAMVIGEGTFKYEWKASEDVDVECYVDGVLSSQIRGSCDWCSESLVLVGDKKHVVCWVCKGGMAAVDSISWQAKDGWIDPLDCVVEVEKSCHLTLDIEEGTRSLTNQSPCVSIIVDPTWAGGDRCLVSVNGQTFADVSIAQILNWSPSAYGTYIFTNTTFVLESVVKIDVAKIVWNDSTQTNITIEVQNGDDIKLLTIPASWFEKYPQLSVRFGSDWKSVLKQTTGKTSADGTPLLVWHDYVAGTDPSKEESIFKATIDFVNGEPVVSWDPDLNENGMKDVRKYVTLGCENIGGEWTDMSLVPKEEKSKYHFFKVKVEMPE